MSNASLKITLQNDLNTAMKAGDEMTKSTLRMLISAVRNAEVAGKQAVDLSDAQVIDVLRAEAKKRAESAELYAGAGRNELADKERAEIAVIERYLPAAIDADALAAIVADEVGKAAAAGQSGPKAMGVVIKAVKERVGGGADGAAIAAAVKSALG